MDDKRQDWNMIAADCFVLSCCCQCLILQILVFLLLKLPTKLFRKTKEYMKRKFGIRRRVARCAAAVIGRQRPQPRRRIMVEDLRRDGCMEEVEKVLSEMYKKGEFGFGSFWRGDDDDDDDEGLVDDNFRIRFVNQQHGYDGNYQFIQVFGPLTMHSI
ncbi:uncharacterized protein LOC112524348 [Cynara cardunculus var. scolymus]|uniref:Transmembrane protein n=1 Tax=Cynara cardunculus var. scolymus TaxID=59895 RepID=A0A103YA44_CYNCS|nr:uncharacterized protein LOC112524348 [Cynara cardunculus var. scolymus]KVI05339.1 hypothetical protein Ccrd_016327 [Cynara cardunculus var. scolymus]